LTHLGNLLYEKGDLAAARPLLERALAIQRKAVPPKDPQLAGTLSGLGLLLLAERDLAGAGPLLEQALAIAQQSLGPQDPQTATALVNLARWLLETGDLTKAQAHPEEALAIVRQAPGRKHHLETARVLANLGALLFTKGDLAGARPLLEQALAIRWEALGPEDPKTWASLNDLSAVLREMNDLGGAWGLLERVLASQRTPSAPDHPVVAAALHNLGALLVEAGDLGGARPLLERALTIRRKEFRLNHPETTHSLSSMGHLLLRAGDLGRARDFFEKALAGTREEFGSEDPDTAHALTDLAIVLTKMGDLAAARPLVEQALAIRRRAPSPDTLASCNRLTHLVILSLALNPPAGALPLLREAAAAYDRLAGRVFSAANDRQRAYFIRFMRVDGDLFLSLAAGPLRGSPEAARAAFELVLRRKALSAEALAVQRDAVLRGRHEALRPLLRQLAGLRGQIAWKTQKGPGPEGGPAHRRQLDEWERQKEQVEAELAWQIPEMNLERQLRAADRRAVALALPGGACLVEYVRFAPLDFEAVSARGEVSWKPARYLAFVLPAGRPDDVEMVDLGEAGPTDELVAAFRRGVLGEGAGHDGTRGAVCVPETGGHADPPSAGERLRHALLDPLREALGRRTRLFLAPDGDLARLPLEVLPADGGGYLLDRYRISYLTSGRDVLRFGLPAGGPPAAPVVVADPDFDLGLQAAPAPQPVPGQLFRAPELDELCFPPLPDGRAEGQEVARLLGQHLRAEVRPWLGPSALETPLKQLRSPWVLHLSTHGFFLADQAAAPETVALELSRRDLLATARPGAGWPVNPLLRSGLALAGANWKSKKFTPPAEAEDGLLTAEDVTGLDLLDTELVVLSACDTGLGEVQAGEGAFGLRRAFVLAGARTLVMSLWKVSDDATRELMAAFYRLVLGGTPRAEALRQAQLQLRERYPDPRHWGAFICQGEPAALRPLQLPGGPPAAPDAAAPATSR
jgi:CHAT domain-containing protein/tetratricopeptide (TPR) repeat protein